MSLPNMLSSRSRSLKTVLSAATSVAATALLIRTISNDFIPDEIRDYFSSRLRSLSNHFSSQLTIVVEEFDGLTLNQLFEATDTYLGTKITPSTRRIKVTKPEKEKQLLVTMDRDEVIVDFFQDVQFKWVLVSTKIEPPASRNHRDFNSILRSEIRSFELSFHYKHKDMALDSYLPYILQKSEAIKEERKAVKLHTIDYCKTDYWGSIKLDHPATFETLAMESELKNMVMDDLERFVKRKEFYRRVGKAWKRGYLLYGPPGTGKSSLIAAMANYLNFDIYDLDLTEVHRNSDLKGLLIGIANRSILVIEDIDCTIELQDRSSEVKPRASSENKVTLSGLLNFIDGLWSSCGDERIIIFTTNNKERLDPALLRPGRMDMHIHMSYCTPCGFKLLASNYLGISDHGLFGEIDRLIEEAEVTAAEVAGELMKSDKPEIALQGLIKFLQNKKIEAEESKACKEERITDGGERHNGKETAQDGQKRDEQDGEGQQGHENEKVSEEQETKE
ncbi:hypothetical protein HHK36_008553 [Tetracentron sinense]|uniref:AAA+ ATPase domain-containing protein n=1 Tax=Tetracentron sinense TaxID=13715 RepID=A0A834ZGK3_TETSI|nr:hypothetical protein HHK36_008553 [Tetracentron sinense]